MTVAFLPLRNPLVALLVMASPTGDVVVVFRMFIADRRRHVDTPSDKLGPRSVGHRLVALVKRGLVELLAGDQWREERFRLGVFDRAHGVHLS